MPKTTERPKPRQSHSVVLRKQLALLEAAEEERLEDFKREQVRRFGTSQNYNFDHARNLVFEIQDRVAQKRVALAQIEGAEAQAAASRAEAENYATREDATFWLRRFIVSLSIGNGAAFAALAAGSLQNDNPQATANLVAAPLHLFALGLVAAGTIPLMMWILRVLPSIATFLAPNPQALPKILQRLAGTYRASLPGLLAFNAVGVASLSALFFLGGLASVASAARQQDQQNALRDFFDVDAAWERVAPARSPPPPVQPAPAESEKVNVAPPLAPALPEKASAAPQPPLRTGVELAPAR